MANLKLKKLKAVDSIRVANERMNSSSKSRFLKRRKQIDTNVPRMFTPREAGGQVSISGPMFVSPRRIEHPVRSGNSCSETAIVSATSSILVSDIRCIGACVVDVERSTASAVDIDGLVAVDGVIADKDEDTLYPKEVGLMALERTEIGSDSREHEGDMTTDQLVPLEIRQRDSNDFLSASCSIGEALESVSTYTVIDPNIPTFVSKSSQFEKSTSLIPSEMTTLSNNPIRTVTESAHSIECRAHTSGVGDIVSGEQCADATVQDVPNTSLDLQVPITSTDLKEQNGEIDQVEFINQTHGHMAPSSSRRKPPDALTRLHLEPVRPSYGTLQINTTESKVARGDISPMDVTFYEEEESLV